MISAGPGAETCGPCIKRRHGNCLRRLRWQWWDGELDWKPCACPCRDGLEESVQ